MNLIALRDNIWDYPSVLLIGKSSVLGRFISFYNSVRPFSYIFTTVIVTLLLGTIIATQIQAVLGFNKDTFVEGIITGTAENGDPIGPTALNPILVNTTQIDRDIMELIYEPLLRVNQDGNIEPILVESYSYDDQSKSYRFSLRKNITWHDGQNFTTADVVATFDLLKELADYGINGSNIAKRAEIEALDDYIFIFKIGGEIIPNFEELITFKILPAHQIEQYETALLASQYSKSERLVSIGTGPFILNTINSSQVKLTANDKYYGGAPKIKNFIFKLLRTPGEAVEAIKSGQLHGITNLSNELLDQLGEIPNMEFHYSDTIYTQYWGLYFELSEGGPEQLKDVNVRKAINQAINKEVIVRQVLKEATPATGPIPSNSPYFSEAFQQPKYNLAAARDILQKAGWNLVDREKNGQIQKIRAKNNRTLEFKLTYINNSDRRELVSLIKSDLAAVGIFITEDPIPVRDFPKAYTGKDWEILLQGVNTFFDPDRYEFFHSSQIPSGESQVNGFNFSSYKSSRQTRVIDDAQGKTVQVPLSDYLLDDARKSTSFDYRRPKYENFQELIYNDVPAVFLYHPTIRYYTSKRVKNIDMASIKTVEERLQSVENWEISYN